MTAPPRAWPVVQAILAELAAITAVLYYLGWIRAAETFRYFGVDVGIIGLTPADYVLRSAPTAIPVIIVLNMGIVAAVELHRRVLRSRLTTIGTRRVGRTLWAVAGIASTAVAVLYVRYADWGSRLGVGLPLLLTLATGSAAAARSVCRTPGHAPRPRADASLPGRMSEAFSGAALVFLAGVGLFWAFALYGAHAARQAARTFHDELPSRPAVTVYSDKLLVMSGATWTEAYTEGAPTKAPAASAYRYRYQGLRLLARTPDGYLLLPERWQRGDAVYLIALGDGVRIDLAGSG